jgi:tRNA(Ile)-lysidine synthase
VQKLLEKFAFKKLAIACSGGVDSMCLAYLAAQETEIAALIIDHNLRAESAAEAQKTSAILSTQNIKNHIIKIDVASDGNMQENARNARYTTLTNWCKKNGYDAIATAHHADDNAENFLLRLARGSGVDGLAGMAAESEMHGIKIIRPLLNYTKKELQEILEKAKIEWVEDASNATNKYSRNKLRHALDKLDDKALITKRINDVATTMSRVSNYLQMETAEAESICVDYKAQEIDLKNYEKLHEEIAYRLLAKILENLSPNDKTARFEKIKNLHSAILNGNKKTLAGLVFQKKANKILIKLEK